MFQRDLRTIGQGLVLVAALLGLIAAALWLRPVGVEPRAQAEGRVISIEGVPRGLQDPGRQREEMIGQLKALNERLANVEKGLRSGEFQMQMVAPKETPASKGTP